MTSVLTAAAVDHRAAATRAASIHLHRHGEAVETSLAGFAGGSGLRGRAVVVPGQSLVEWYPHGDQPLEQLADPAMGVVASGWRLWVVVPAHRMGEAHRALHRSALTLQAWWHDDGSVRFGGPEVP